jgi:hypothetical protein
MSRCLNPFLLVYYVWDKEVCRSRLEFKKDIIYWEVHMILNPTPGNYTVPFFLADVFLFYPPPPLLIGEMLDTLNWRFKKTDSYTTTTTTTTTTY